MNECTRDTGNQLPNHQLTPHHFTHFCPSWDEPEYHTVIDPEEWVIEAMAVHVFNDEGKMIDTWLLRWEEEGQSGSNEAT